MAKYGITIRHGRARRCDKGRLTKALTREYPIQSLNVPTGHTGVSFDWRCMANILP